MLALSLLLVATTVWLVGGRGGPKRREHRGRRRRLRPAAVTAGAVLAVALALAGCGGSSSSSGVAHLSTSSTSARPSTTTGGASSSESNASTQQKMVAYAQCMRTHGVPSFPDPSSGGVITKEAAIRAFKELTTSQIQTAQTACRRLQPNGGQPSKAEIAQHLDDLLAFAACMRTHGVPNFPDPTSSGQVTHELLARAGISVHQPGVLPAAYACVSVTHGTLTKAAVARFAEGH